MGAVVKYSTDYWRKDEDIQLANVRGFSMLEKLPKLLKQAYPDLAVWSFGFFTKKDLPSRYSDGWVHFTTEYFPDEDVSSFNQAIGLRFHLENCPEGLKYKENYIMIQPVDYYRRRLEKIAQISHEQFEQNTKKEDGSFEGKVVMESSYEETPVIPAKRGPGRPRKNKE